MGEMKAAGWLFAGLAALTSSTGYAKPEKLPEGARYVALGSSFAAGPGVGPHTPGAPARCGRGTLNYPNLLAAKLKLQLVDATCSGATTEHVLGPWAELPPQIDSVDAETRLVTITIGGNDIALVGNIFAALCEQAPPAATPCPRWRTATDAEWQGDEDRMRKIVREVHRRAPKAQVVLVDYITVLPPRGKCAALPISDARMAESRSAAKRLAAMTARIARQEDATLLKFSDISRGHAPCSKAKWSNGAVALPNDGIPVHPNKLGHQAAAESLARLLR